ncbi:sensor histidine kinase [uncultured Friedmanniella sp.]|uniref:sensor histidine kinase n=1 Tax=uncultured Friedmanniella sp. TaxID=335381 RepID=UPI0035CB477C
MEQRLRLLVTSLRDVSRELTVAGRLRSMVELAAAIGNAAYAAFAVRLPDGTVDRFVFSSYVPGELRAMQGILAAHGVGDAEQLPLALGRTSRSRLSAGRRGNEEIGGDLIDLPVQTHLGLSGNLYAMRPMGGAVFSEQDQQLLADFVDSSAAGINNATQLEEAWRRQHWLIASSEISRKLLGGVEDEDEILRSVAESVQLLADARTVTVCIPSEDDPDLMDVRVAAGLGAAELENRRYEAAGSLTERAILAGTVQMIVAGELPCIHSEVTGEVDLGHVISLPLTGRLSTQGAIMVSRAADQPSFAASDIVMAGDFATQAALALELAEARSAQHTLEAREDRERIAESVQDQVVQRLFSIGLSLQSTARGEVSGPGRERVSQAIADIDETIRQVRSSIDPHTAGRPSVGYELHAVALAAAAEVEALLGFRPAVVLTGSFDQLPPIGADVADILRTALADLAEHSRPTSVQIELVGEGEGFSLVLTDDGAGFGQRSWGLSQLWQQAEQLGRTLNVEQAGRGLRLRWTFAAH